MVKLSTPRPVKAVVTKPARARWTSYQNTSGRPKLILVCCLVARGTADTYSRAQLRVSTTDPPPPGDIICDVGYDSSGPIQSGTFLLAAAVPNNYYYELTDNIQAGSGGSVTLLYWVEVEL